ncbi:MAG: hypothetical protein NZM29_04120, partial [Nitrospira sp.]|nr:hypothetical protein [Nitrospira sp.]
MAKRIRLIAVGLAGTLFGLIGWSFLHAAIAADPRVVFELTDEPGAWFRNAAGPVAGFQALAVVTPGTEVRFTGKSNTVHTRTSLLFPTGAINMPFDTPHR